MRSEHHYERDGIRYRVLEEPRVRYPPKPLRRTRMPLVSPDPDQAMARLDDDRVAMAERVLREGIRGRRRWSTLRRRSGTEFSPLLVETELLDDLCRRAGLIIEDRWRSDRWIVDTFEVDESMRSWLGLVDPVALRAELERELRAPTLRNALEDGPPPGIDWRSFAFVLRAGQQVLELRDHGLVPSQRELAGLVDHTKAWTPRRKELLGELLGDRFENLVATLDRQIGIRGPVTHPEGGLWASVVGEVDLSIGETVVGAILVENLETFRTLTPLADDGWIVLHVPGGPPPAECELLRRLADLDPDLAFQAAFDLDPAGIRIARIVQARTGIDLQTVAMTPQLLDAAPHGLELNDWDLDQLTRLDGAAGPLEPLRAAIVSSGRKVEQETLQRELLAMLHEPRHPRRPDEFI